MSLTPDRTPQYEQIGRLIRERILSGELTEGEDAPSAAEIERESGVSRPTAQQALRWLTEQGLVATRTGLPHVVLSLHTVPAPAEVAEQLGIAPGAPVRVLADGRSVTYYRVD